MAIPNAPETATLSLVNPGITEATITATGYSASGEVLANSTLKLPAGSSWSGTQGDLFHGASMTNMTHVRLMSDLVLHGFETITADDRMEMMPVMGRE